MLKLSCVCACACVCFSVFRYLNLLSLSHYQASRLFHMQSNKYSCFVDQAFLIMTRRRKEAHEKKIGGEEEKDRIACHMLVLYLRDLHFSVSTVLAVFYPPCLGTFVLPYLMHICPRKSPKKTRASISPWNCDRLARAPLFTCLLPNLDGILYYSALPFGRRLCQGQSCRSSQAHLVDKTDASVL